MVVAHEIALVDDLDVAAVAHGARLRVLVDVDVGQRRGGASTPADAVAVANRVRAAPNLELRGVQGYDGHLQGIAEAAQRAAGHVEAMARLDAVLAAFAAAGHTCAIVTTAGTATASLAAAHPTVTEIQPGSYALMDAAYARLDEIAFRQAAHVLTTVTAVLGPREIIVDAGTRAVSADQGPALVAGLDATWESAGDEHGRIRGDVGHLRTGDQIRLIPSHTDTTVVLHGPPVLI
jgi:3-hydroxy-D-aspartate aldolase